MINIESAYLSKLINTSSREQVLEDGFTISEELVSLNDAYLILLEISF